MNFNGKKITVLGAGESGVHCALLLKRKGARVFVSELNENRVGASSWKALMTAGFTCEFGRHSWDRIRDSDLIVISPGIPPSAEIYRQVQKAKIPMWSEIEVAFRCTRADIVAVTGTNGKTTVTTLIRDVLLAAGRSAVSCGNIGNSFSRLVDQLDPSMVAVVEVSSFQLANVVRFRPRISVLLNLSPNHLDWHEDYEDYVRAKCRIFENQSETDIAVVNRSDRECVERSQNLACRVEYFDEKDHTNLNFAAVQKVAEIFRVDPATTQSVLQNFSGLEHRLEDVGVFEEVRYINDSKSTTVASLGWALDRVPKPLILIAGGRHKGGDFRLLRGQIHDRVKYLIAFGESKKSLVDAFYDLVPVREAATLEEAMTLARQSSQSRDTILFSPACASFDLFRDYRDRGLKFKEIMTQWRRAVSPAGSR